MCTWNVFVAKCTPYNKLLKKAISFVDHGNINSFKNYSNIFCDQEQEYFLSLSLILKI